MHDLLQPRGTWAGYAASTRADARGRFRVRGTFGSACSMRVEAPGFYTRQLPWISIGMPFDVSLEASGFVHGAVVDDDGAPLEGFVLLLHEYASTEPGSAVRLTAGRYRLPIAMRGRFRVAVFDAQDLPLVESDVLAGPGEVRQHAAAGAQVGPVVDIELEHRIGGGGEFDLRLVVQRVLVFRGDQFEQHVAEAGIVAR